MISSVSRRGAANALLTITTTQSDSVGTVSRDKMLAPICRVSSVLSPKETTHPDVARERLNKRVGRDHLDRDECGPAPG